MHGVLSNEANFWRLFSICLSCTECKIKDTISEWPFWKVSFCKWSLLNSCPGSWVPSLSFLPSHPSFPPQDLSTGAKFTKDIMPNPYGENPLGAADKWSYFLPVDILLIRSTALCSKREISCVPRGDWKMHCMFQREEGLFLQA